eukprot:1619533-Rhodomonas_salina.1
MQKLSTNVAQVCKCTERQMHKQFEIVEEGQMKQILDQARRTRCAGNELTRTRCAGPAPP